MKKNSIKLLFLLLIIALYFVYTTIPKKLYKQGLDCYNHKNYACAAKYMQDALKFNNGNLDARYYYVKSLSALGPNYYREKILYKFATNKKNDSAKTVANNTLIDWYRDIIRHYPYNYIDQAISGKNIIRWSRNSFPLRVYIDEDNNVPEYYKPAVVAAFSKWSKSIDFVGFKLTKNPDAANITVRFENTPESDCNESGCHYETGFTTPKISQKILKRMDITLYDTNSQGEYFSAKKIYETALHEIGHALGIMGHSYDSEDIMYSVDNDEDIYSQFDNNLQNLSGADRGTIKLLYRLNADIIDTDENKEKLIYAPLIIGSHDERLSKKIKELELYIRQAPEIAAGYINLGGLYAENEDFIKAQIYLEQGLKYANSDSDKYAIYYNLAYVYYRIQDYTQAAECCQKAYKIKATPELLELMNAVNIELQN